jgi:hypothetical protein
MASPKAKGDFVTPSDGYRQLAVDILLDAIKDADLVFLSSDLGQACLDLVNIHPGRAIAELKRGDGNGHDR